MKKLHRKIKSYLQRFRLFLGRLILDKTPSKKWNQSLLPNSKILFIRHDGKIGDFIVSSFVYREIKKQYPNIHIGVVVVPDTKYLFDSDLNIDSLYVVGKRSLFAFWQIARKIAKEHYDIVIDLTDFLRNRDILLIRTVNAAINIGSYHTELKLFNHKIDENTHITQDYQNALAILGFNSVECAYSFPNIPVTNELKVFCQQKLNKDYVAINFFGAANHKKFSVAKQIEWLATLKMAYPDRAILVLTYPNVTEELKSSLPKNAYLMYENTTSIFDSIELIRNASLVISPDTSIVHIASALNKRIIAFYMESNPKQPYRKWFPINNGNADIYYYASNINEVNIDMVKLD